MCTTGPSPQKPSIPAPPVTGDQAADWKYQIEARRLQLEEARFLLDQMKTNSEQQKIIFEQKKLDEAWFNESFKALNEFSRMAIQLAFILNGGAAIALITNLAAGGRDAGSGKVAISALANPLLFLSFGMVAAVVTAAISYISQSNFSHRRDKIGIGFQIAAMVSWISSISLFVVAAFSVSTIMATTQN